MTVTEYLRVLRRHWWIVVLLAALSMAGAAAFTYRQTPEYTADTTLYVSVGSGSQDASELQSGSSVAQLKVKSYATLINSPNVLQPVIDTLHLGTTVGDLASRVSAQAQLDTVVLDVSVKDSDPDRAADIANLIAQRFPQYVAQLETPAGSRRSPVTITQTDTASAPSTPTSPRVPLNLALGLLVGLGLGVGAAVLREQLNTTVSDPGVLVDLTGAQPLGGIPFDGRTDRQPVVPVEEADGRAEAFRTLRTNLTFVDVDRPPQVVVVTSAMANEGKSVTAANLALTLSLSSARVILVDCDLRRPSVGKILGLSSAAGLTSVLSGRHDLRDVVVTYQRDMLAVLPAGPPPPNPAELLGSQHMSDLLTKLANHYDVVVIDAPPLLPVTDAAVLARVADGALLVVRHGRSRKEDVARAVQALRAVNARLLGTVLNCVPRQRHHGRYGYTEYPTIAAPAVAEAPAEVPAPRPPEQIVLPDVAPAETFPVPAPRPTTKRRWRPSSEVDR